MRRNQKGFTLMELMVVIVIVAILAAVAVPLYINYVRDAQRTEARGAIAAIVTAEQVHLQRFQAYIPYTNAQFQTPPATPDARLDVDITEALANWTIDVAVGDPLNAFTVTATGNANRPSENLTVIYNHDRANPPANPWTEN
jgi:prepilin-type N-terminal cleavage/methylation domain-containing protein